MAALTGITPARTFRTRAVYVAGAVGVTIGVAVLIVGVALTALQSNRNSLPLGLVVCLIGLILLLDGLGRMMSRLEVRGDRMTWTWGFSRHEVLTTDLEDAALVEKGSPFSGASWAGFLGAGLLRVFVWWLSEVIVRFFSTEPSIGSLDLVLMRRHGAPIEVKSISAWSTSTLPLSGKRGIASHASGHSLIRPPLTTASSDPTRRRMESI